MKQARLPKTRTLNDRVLVVTVPVSFHQAGGRKQIVTPLGMPDWRPTSPRCDNSMITALAKAHRWRRSIEAGEHPSAAELARKENVNESYLCRVLRLTLLAPDIVQAILDGRQPKTLELKDLLRPLPLYWPAQRKALGFIACESNTCFM